MQQRGGDPDLIGDLDFGIDRCFEHFASVDNLYEESIIPSINGLSIVLS
jgi:hypothetical protein